MAVVDELRQRILQVTFVEVDHVIEQIFFDTCKPFVSGLCCVAAGSTAKLATWR
jgi:hypothetical protein